jgi:deoxycytidylate deaminase
MSNTTSPPDAAIALAKDSAARSPCRSKRGVVVYASEPLGPPTILGAGYNGPPASFDCPGRERCAGNCGQRSVHAETRALRMAQSTTLRLGRVDLDLVHVELAADGGVVACDGPSCWQCSREILDVGFVAGVWLYLGLSRCLACRRFEDSSERDQDRRRRCPECGANLTPRGIWRRYAAAEFHRSTLRNAGLEP